jgi:hypothetical protein
MTSAINANLAGTRRSAAAIAVSYQFRARLSSRRAMPDPKPPASIRRARLAQRARIAIGIMTVAAIAYRLLRYFR